MRKRKFLALLLCLSLAVGLLPMAALAAESGDGSAQYVLMNIPYAEFYAAELGQNGVDAITSATLNGKARNVNVNGASYHQSEAAVTAEGIAGATFPVKASAEDLAALKEKGAVEVTDSAALSYEMTARGQTSKVELKGAQVLQESPSYSYYVLSETPASYKEIQRNGDTVSFGKAVGTTASGTITGEVAAPGRHADIEIALSGVEIAPADVSGVIVTTARGSWALHHVVNVWRGTEIGWNLSDMDLGGQTITKVTYFQKDGTVTEYGTNIAIPQTGYVLMNIPYADFYKAELGENGSVDAVSGATLKYANSGLAGGSYHDVDAVDADSQVKALGATYPVYVSDMSKLDASLEVKPDAATTIGIVSGREKTITPTEVTGQDTLFCAPSYSWMKLADKPVRYKTATAEGDAFTFSAVSGRASTVEGVTGSASYYTHHGNFVEVRLNGVTIEEAVNGVLVTFKDGSVTALPHVQGFWQKTQIGWASSDAVAGKTITNVRFITANAVYDCPVEIPVKLDGGSITAEFADANTLTVTGLPADIANPVAKVQTQVGRGEKPTVIAENAVVTDGKIVTTDPAAAGTTYAVSVTSDNYGDLSATAKLPDFSQVIGEYQPLFEGATFNSAYDHDWHDYVAAVVGESTADDTVAYMKASVGAKGYGEQNEAPNFFCGFTHDVTAITFGEDGKTVTFTKTDGTSVTHTYAFVKQASASGKYGEYDMAMDGSLYQAQEAPADEFQYLLMFPDTPETTYHLEFRYAETEEDVLNLLDGPYGYWVGSAIQKSALTEENEETLQNVISLFVVENLAGNTTAETNTQRAGLVGTWDFTDSETLKEFGFDSMYIVLSADGTGRTYVTMNGSSEPIQVSEYTFFAYDPDKNDGKDAGTYIALNPDAETVTPGEYEIKTISGKKALVFNSTEGEIIYYLRTAQPSGGGGGGTVTPAANTVTTVTAENGSVSVSADKAKSGDKVTVTVKPNEGYKVDTVKVTDKNGKEIPVTDNADGTYTYTMPASAVTVTPSFVPADQTTPAARGFVDVPADAYYAAPVAWAVEKGVTTGVDDTHFAPDASCTRAQMVTFLWRAAGSPAPAVGENPFADVASSDYFCDAVLWAVEEGITQGTDAVHFSPDATVDRAQSVTFLYRLSGEKTDGQNPFNDVAEGAYYYDAVLWAAGQGVTNGTSDNVFSPNADCTRGQIVTLLYRSAEKARI